MTVFVHKKMKVLVVRLVLVALNICHYWHFLIQEYL